MYVVCGMFCRIDHCIHRHQWRNRRGGQGAVCPPETSDQEIFDDVSGKKRQGKKGKGVKSEKKRKKIVKGKVESYKMKRGPFFFFFFFFFFLLHFWKRQKFVLGLPKWEFSSGKKKNSRREKNQEKWLCPLRKICLLRPWQTLMYSHGTWTQWSLGRITHVTSTEKVRSKVI